MALSLVAIATFRVVRESSGGGDTSFARRGLDPRVVSAVSYLLSQDLAKSPYEALVADFLGRRFEVPELLRWRGAIVDYFSTKAGHESLYLRLLEPGDLVPADVVAERLPSLESVGAVVYFPLRTLHCDRWPLPPDFSRQLADWGERGGYVSTHVALAMLWAFELRCLDPTLHIGLEDSLGRKLSEIVDSEIFPGDLYAEALATLAYMKGGGSVPPSYFDRLLQVQNGDGGFRHAEGDSSSDVHTTVLAVWAFLERAHPYLPRGGWLTDVRAYGAEAANGSVQSLAAPRTDISTGPTAVRVWTARYGPYDQHYG